MALDEGIHVEQASQRTSLSPALCMGEELTGSCLITPRTSRATPNICLAILI
jgi:hypothetical protein